MGEEKGSVETRLQELDVRLKKRQLSGRPAWWDVLKFAVTLAAFFFAFFKFSYEQQQDRVDAVRTEIQNQVERLENRPHEALAVLPLQLIDFKATAEAAEYGELRKALLLAVIPLVHGAPPADEESGRQDWAKISLLASRLLLTELLEDDSPSARDHFRREARRGSEALPDAIQAFADTGRDEPVYVEKRRLIEDLCQANIGIHRLLGEAPASWCETVTTMLSSKPMQALRSQCISDCSQGA